MTHKHIYNTKVLKINLKAWVIGPVAKLKKKEFLVTTPEEASSHGHVPTDTDYCFSKQHLQRMFQFLEFFADRVMPAMSNYNLTRADWANINNSTDFLPESQ